MILLIYTKLTKSDSTAYNNSYKIIKNKILIILINYSSFVMFYCIILFMVQRKGFLITKMKSSES